MHYQNQVITNNFLILKYFIVFVLIGNKDDMYKNQCVDDDEAKHFAKEINAIFLKTSAKECKGINELFIIIGKKILNPKDDSILNDNLNILEEKIKLIKNLKEEVNKYKKINEELNTEKNTLKNELDNQRELNEKLTKENQSLKEQINNSKISNDKFEYKIRELREENNKLNNDLLKANKIISNFNDNKKNIEENNNQIQINYLNEIIKMKDSQINNLTTQLNFIGTSGKKLVDFDNIMVVNFISSDQSVNCGIKCLKTDTLAEVEEKLYQRYEEFRETNNNFLANGRLLLRFKKLCENGIKDGDKLQLIRAE